MIHPAVKLIQGHMKITGMTQREVARVIGTTPPQLSKWINGRHNPCRAWQMRIAQVLGRVQNPVVGKMKRLDHSGEETVDVTEN